MIAVLARATVTHFAKHRGPPAAFVPMACGILLPAAAHCADPSCPICRLAIGAGPRIVLAAVVVVDADAVMCPACQETRLLELDAGGGAVCLVCARTWTLEGRAP